MFTHYHNHVASDITKQVDGFRQKKKRFDFKSHSLGKTQKYTIKNIFGSYILI